MSARVDLVLAGLVLLVVGLILGYRFIVQLGKLFTEWAEEHING
jgi:hypothetical protein